MLPRMLPGMFGAARGSLGCRAARGWNSVRVWQACSRLWGCSGPAGCLGSAGMLRAVGTHQAVQMLGASRDARGWQGCSGLRGAHGQGVRGGATECSKAGQGARELGVLAGRAKSAGAPARAACVELGCPLVHGRLHDTATAGQARRGEAGQGEARQGKQRQDRARRERARQGREGALPHQDPPPTFRRLTPC